MLCHGGSQTYNPWISSLTLSENAPLVSNELTFEDLGPELQCLLKVKEDLS